MAVEIKNYEEFKKLVISSAVPVIVDFYAVWCGPCKMIAPTIEELSEEGKKEGFAVYKINVDECPDIAEEFNVSSIPTIVGFADGKEASRQIGLADKKRLRSLISM